MRSARQLEDSINDEQREADALEQQAQRAEQKANEYDAATEASQQQREMLTVAEFYAKAQIHKKNVADYEREKADIEREVNLLEQKKLEVIRIRDNEINDIEQQRRKLKGE